MSEEVKEELTITVDDKKEDKIKELSFTLNTLDQGFASYITSPINGKFEAVILESNMPCQVRITFAEHPNILLFDSSNVPIYDSVYLPLRVQPISKDYEGFTQAYEEWCLNNSIKCEVQGQMNTTVKVILRYY